MPRTRWLAEKRAELAALADLPVTNIVPSRRDFIQFVATQKQGIALVPRIQRTNPYTGRSWPALDWIAFASACDDADAGAISVRTAQIFGGAIEDLTTVAAAVTAPVLRDDLCLDRPQLYQARLAGADAVVLPAAELGEAALRDAVAVASSMHMASVIEVAAPGQLAAALAAPAACIGLACATADGYADHEGVASVAAVIPVQRTVLLLAEVRALDDLLPLAGRIDAAVVGDALLDAPDPGAAIASFLARLG